MSRPAGIDIFEDRVLRKEQYDLQRAAGSVVRQGFSGATAPTRKELLRLQRSGVELSPELKKKLGKRKRKAKKRTNLKQEIARGFREQRKWERQRRNKPDGPIVNIGDAEARAQEIAQAAAMGAAAAAALAPAGGGGPPPGPPPPPAAPIIVPPAPAAPIVIHGVGGGGGAPPPLLGADIDRIRQAVRADLAPVRAGQAAAAQAQAQQAAALRQAQADIVAGRQEVADVRADVVAGRQEGEARRLQAAAGLVAIGDQQAQQQAQLAAIRQRQAEEGERVGAGFLEQRQRVEDVGRELEAVREGGFDILQRQRVAQEELRGELGLLGQDIAERRAVDLLAQRERDQLLEAQQAQLIERFDLQDDEFSVGRQYAQAMEQAERERLEREEARAAANRRDIEAIDRRSQELVQEIRAAQVQQGQEGSAEARRAEARLNDRIDELRLTDSQVAAAGRRAEQQHPDETPPRRPPPGQTSPGPAVEQLRAEQIEEAEEEERRRRRQSLGLRADDPSPRGGLPATRSGAVVREEGVPVSVPAVRGAGSSPVSIPDSPARPGWESGPTLHDGAAPEPEIEPVQARPLELSGFDWDAPPRRAEGVDRGSLPGGDENQFAAEQSRQPAAAPPTPEQVAEEMAEGWRPGSEVLEEEAAQAQERRETAAAEDTRAEERQQRQEQALERLEQLPAPPPEQEGGEGFREGDVGRGPPGSSSPGPNVERIRQEDAARLEQLGGVEYSPEP